MSALWFLCFRSTCCWHSAWATTVHVLQTSRRSCLISTTSYSSTVVSFRSLMILSLRNNIDCLLTAFYESSRNWKLKFEGVSNRLLLQTENIQSCNFFVPVWHLSLLFRVVAAEFQFSASHFALTFWCFDKLLNRPSLLWYDRPNSSPSCTTKDGLTWVARARKKWEITAWKLQGKERKTAHLILCAVHMSCANPPVDGPSLAEILL